LTFEWEWEKRACCFELGRETQDLGPAR
jgi:hypothetical protein